ncbi:MAG: response regulator [Armatimonadetes bacterium]|nr:response regulator [Armatimonadota bacterium]
MDYRKLLVLVVDDEPFVARVIRTVLEESGLAKVLIAQTGAEMWQVLAEAEPDLFLIDILLPDAHGAALLRKLREHGRFKHVPVIILTGVAGVENLDEYTDLAAEVVSKPVAPHVLKETVRRYAARKPSGLTAVVGRFGVHA